MKQIKCIRPGQLVFEEEDKPIPADGETLVRILKIGICGTDLHAVEGTQPFFTYPRILGHELAVEIVHPGFKKGELGTVVPYFSCGTCHMCRSGRPNACVSLRVCGVHVDGGMKEYFSVPTRNIIVSQNLTPEQLALVEPLAVGAHAVRRARIAENDTVLVLGAGPIGIATILYASLSGAKVIAVDMNPWRLDFCKTIRGVTTMTGKPKDLSKNVQELTEGKMPSTIFDATGNLLAIQSGFELMAHGGQYVLVGLQKENVSFSHPEFHKREGTLMSSRNATHADFQFVMETISNGQIDPLRLITHRIEFDDAVDGFQLLLTPGTKSMKGIIEL